MTMEEATEILNRAAYRLVVSKSNPYAQYLYDSALENYRKTAEAVLSGTPCQSVEQHMPETTTKGEQG